MWLEILCFIHNSVSWYLVPPLQRSRGAWLGYIICWGFFIYPAIVVVTFAALVYIRKDLDAVHHWPKLQSAEEDPWPWLLADNAHYLRCIWAVTLPVTAVRMFLHTRYGRLVVGFLKGENVEQLVRETDAACAQ